VDLPSVRVDSLRRLSTITSRRQQRDHTRSETRATENYVMTIKELNTVEIIMRLVCAKYSVTLSELESHSRPWRIVWPRFVAIALISKYTAIGQIKIGKLFNRDHGSISKSIRAFNRQIETSPKTSEEISELETRLKITI
jgi:chromosomal replication initiation ATPase DnaA